MTGLNHRYFVRNFAIPVSTPFFPTDLTGLTAWYDASNAGSITASGGLVSQWNDLSGNGNHATQGSGVAQPTTGSRTQNSLNVLDFDGTSDWLRASTFNLGSQPFTAMLIYKADSGIARIVDAAATRSLAGAGSVYGIYAGTGGADTAVSATFNAVCLMVMFNGASSKVQVDSTLTTGLNPGSNGWSDLLICSDPGQSTLMDGFAAELAFWTGDQSASFGSMLGYSQSKWATP